MAKTPKLFLSIKMEDQPHMAVVDPKDEVTLAGLKRMGINKIPTKVGEYRLIKDHGRVCLVSGLQADALTSMISTKQDAEDKVGQVEHLLDQSRNNAHQADRALRDLIKDVSIKTMFSDKTKVYLQFWRDHATEEIRVKFAHDDWGTRNQVDMNTFIMKDHSKKYPDVPPMFFLATTYKHAGAVIEGQRIYTNQYKYAKVMSLNKRNDILLELILHDVTKTETRASLISFFRSNAQIYHKTSPQHPDNIRKKKAKGEMITLYTEDGTPIHIEKNKVFTKDTKFDG